jgi:hypothetical protein
VQTKKTWKEKCIAKEEESYDGEDSQVTPEEESNHSVMHDSHDGAHSGKEMLEVNKVFTLPTEFRMPEFAMAEQRCGAERAVFEKPAKAGEHMKPLYIKGHLDGNTVSRMMVDGGGSVNIMPLSLFEKLRHNKGDLKQTNMSLSGFSGEPAEAKEIVCK